MVLYAGHEGEGAPHTEGVGIMLSREEQPALISWEAVSPRIITAGFTTNQSKIKMNIIPLMKRTEEMKEEFYNQLQAVVSKQGAKDIMGDVNAKIGADNRAYEPVMGRHGLGTMNENGELRMK